MVLEKIETTGFDALNDKAVNQFLYQYEFLKLD